MAAWLYIVKTVSRCSPQTRGHSWLSHVSENPDQDVVVYELIRIFKVKVYCIFGRELNTSHIQPFVGYSPLEYQQLGVPKLHI